MGSTKKRVQYSYDAVGNRIGMVDPDGGRFTYAYDSVGRTTSVVNPQGERTTFSYDANGRQTLKQLANGTRASFTYDDANQLSVLRNLKSDGTVISQFDYSYDKAGTRTAVAEADGSRVTWLYDDTYQLTEEHRTGSTPFRNTFTYDSAGNRTLKNEAGTRTTYAYDPANQLRYGETAGGRTTYTYDADGNQQLVTAPNSDRTTTLWDYENKATEVQLPSGIRNTMSYAPDGLRVKLEDSTGTKKLIWDDQNYLAETDENNDTQAVYTNEPAYYGNLISQRRGSNTSYYHYEALGSTRELTDAAEAITDTYLYDAWGVPLATVGSTINPFRYVGNVGYYFDIDTQDNYIRARVYRPETGRWLSIDPLQFFGGYNLYKLYRVINATDPSGMRPDGEVPKYTNHDVNKCNTLILSITQDKLRAFGNTYPCAKELLQRFKSKKGGTFCPASCKSEMQQGLSHHFSSDRGSNALDTKLFGGCGTSTVKTWEEDSLFAGSINFKSGDLLYAFGKFSFTFSGAGHLICGPGTVDPCCCDCNGAATLEGNTTDDYDFCSSLSARALPPWQESGIIPSARSLAWCGCVLEDWYKRFDKIGSDSVGGKTFKIDCPIRLSFLVSDKFCEKPEPNHK